MFVTASPRALAPPRVFDLPVGVELHPAVRTWFERRFPDGPTPPQVEAWPRIAAGEHTLVAAPTGSGKTLSAFLMCIDRLYQEHARGETVEGSVHVVYVSPLKALAVDIKENLDRPLDEIAAIAKELGMSAPDLRAVVRTGDTTASERASIVRKPPAFLVTTPESLYLLLTAERSREVLRTARWVIVDEIHALARDKRGSHLALSLERLEHVCAQPPVRIGLSATQKPLSTVAELLVGSGDERRAVIVDSGHQRPRDLELVLPGSELEAVASAEQMGEILDTIAELVQAHRTTLVFVNTRRLAERLAHQLGERLGDDVVAAHHGSLSKDRRHRVETRLRAGDLRALVATASLELGIDIGPVELVCQIGSPRSIATFLQRVGRSGHTRYGTPKGRLFPLTRDELVECAALFHAIEAGHLDALCPPTAPLDILAQQIVAETAAERWTTDALYDCFRQAAPYRSVTREVFDEVVEFVAGGVMTGRGVRGNYVQHDEINHELTGRRAARLAALTSGGAIPELADYRVLADPDDTLIGTVNEDWAIESMAGDVFLLGTHTWRIRRVESGIVRVIDAQGATPTIPFWFGEAPGRTAELGEEVSIVRATVDAFLERGEPDAARAWLMTECRVDDVAAATIVSYLATSRAVLGRLPTCDQLVIERFFDDTGGMQLVVHSPYGARINRAFGLALRKRFCTTFDFELQAAANDDAVVLSLGPQHSFPLEQVVRFLRSDQIEVLLQQAILRPMAPMFTARWRWNLNRSLMVLRWKGGRRNPPPIQRMEADDIMASVFPQGAACQENVGMGPIDVGDHVLVRQTIHDTMTEAMDIDGLRSLLARVEQGAVSVWCTETTEPSPLAHEILNGKPYTYLDDAPLEERRTRAISLRRGLPVDLDEIGQVDPTAIERVREEVMPDIRNADELHDLLLSLVVVPPRADWDVHMSALAERGRASTVAGRWVATERRSMAESLAAGGEGAEQAVRGALEVSGPTTAHALASATTIPVATVRSALAALERQGFAIQGAWEEPDQWCARRLLARIHSYSVKRRRQDVDPVTAQMYMQFLFRWQHVAPDDRLQGTRGLIAVVEQLQGFEIPAVAWESQILASRLRGYRPFWLDECCYAGDIAWNRFTLPSIDDDTARSPSRATPLSLCIRADRPWLLRAVRGDREPAMPAMGALAEIAEALERSGARFHAELADDTRRLPTDIEQGLWDGVARGVITADGFHAIRSLMDARRADTRPLRSVPDRGIATGLGRSRRRGLRRGASERRAGEGRWSLVPEPSTVEEPDELAEAVAEQLLARWGVVFRDLAVRESLALPWRDLQWALRRLEARGVVRGGRFVTGFSGEQFARPDAVELLRHVRRQPRVGEVVTISAADPCNLTGVITPGPRVPALHTRTLTYRDGLPVEDQAAGALPG